MGNGPIRDGLQITSLIPLYGKLCQVEKTVLKYVLLCRINDVNFAILDMLSALFITVIAEKCSTLQKLKAPVNR